METQSEDKFDPEAALRGRIEILDNPEQQKAQALANALLELNAQISVVKGARIDYATDMAEWKRREDEFAKANSELASRLFKEIKSRDEAEDKLRELTLAAYVLNGNKKPAPGVGVKIQKKVIIDDRREAYKWAMEHRTCLSLDLGAFEALVKESSKDTFPDWVHLKEEPQATISKDLGGA
jgi:hypothetical protein